MEAPELTREQVLKRDIPWETYLTAKLITGSELQLLKHYDHKPESVQTTLLKEDGSTYIRVFVLVLRDITKEETVEYVLALLDELLSIDPKRARLFHKLSMQNEDLYLPFLRLLSKKNWFVQEKACEILTLLISARPRDGEAIGTSNGTLKLAQASPSTFKDVLQDFVDWICDQLRQPSHPSRGIPVAVSSLAKLLGESKVRTMFVHADGVKLLAPLIYPATSQHHIQVLYEAILCMWLLSFYDAAVDTIASTQAVPRLVEVAKSSTKEKVVRVTILTLKNLLSKGTFGSEMVELNLPKVVQSLKLQAWSDEDLIQALDALEISLNDNIRLLSLFEKYEQELLSGNLDWTPVHKNPTFWRENIQKFEENNFWVLRILITILDNSQDFKTLAVACHDLAQFVQNHPAGRGIMIDLKAKHHVMRLMNHENAEVRREALLCAQKFLLSAKYLSYLQ